MSDKTEKKYLIDNPTLMAEWDWEKNNELGLEPEKLLIYSNKQANWKCIKGHTWPAQICNRTNGRNCPYCSNKRVLIGFNDLTTTAPHLAKEWNYEKNKPLLPENFTIGSGKKVWWICPLGHEYPARILHRGHGTNCPECNSGRQTSFAEQALYYYVKQMYPDAINRVLNILDNRMELDIYIPSISCAIEYDGIFWHKKSKAKNRETEKYKKCIEKGIYLLRVRECNSMDEQINSYSGEVRHAKVKADYIFYIREDCKKEELNVLIREILDKLESQAYLFRTVPKYIAPSIIDIDVKRDEFEIRKYMQSVKVNSLATLYPDLSREWHPTRNENFLPSMFTPGSDFPAYWKCNKCGHEWQAIINHRVGGTGCPQCYRLGLKVKHPNDIPIFQYNIDGTFIKEWRSSAEAGRELKISSANIRTCAIHERKKAGGYRWEYQYMEKLNPLTESRLKAVLQMGDAGEVIREFDSIRSAAKALKIDETTISHVLHGRLQHAGGFRWKFKDSI